MSATGRGAVRRVDDYYATPAWCVRALLDRLELPGGLWLEPAAGEGAIVRAVDEVRRDVIWNVVERNLEHLRVLGSSVQPSAVVHFAAADFIHRAACLDWDRIEVVITNPPYGQAREFVEACLVSPGWVVMLLRLNWLGSQKRAELLREYAPDVYVLPRRPSFTGQGTDATEYAWFVWPPGDKLRRAGRLEILGCTPA